MEVGGLGMGDEVTVFLPFVRTDDVDLARGIVGDGDGDGDGAVREREAWSGLCSEGEEQVEG
jgi:hypothetical protein